MTQSVKISSGLYKKLKTLANRENRFVGKLLDKAVENYLRAKKVIPLVCLKKTVDKKHISL